MTDTSAPFAPLTAAAKALAGSALAEGTRKLLFHQLHNTKGYREAFADFVIVVRGQPRAGADKEQFKTALKETCADIMKRLSEAGLKLELRRGSVDLVFIFVLCSPSRLKQEVYRSRIQDWLTGVRIRDIDDEDDDDDDSLGSNLDLTDAERLRLVHNIIVNSRSEGGAGIRPGIDKFQMVEGLLPLHDHQYNEAWIKAWSTKWLIEKDDLMRLRDHFGEKIGYYFAFLQYYTIWLIAPSIAGLFTYFFLDSYSVLFSVFTVSWSLLFTEFWRRKERELAIWWGTRSFSRVEQRRPEFHEETYVKNPITGEIEPFFPPWKRWLRRAIAAPVIIACSITLSFVLLVYILFEVIMSEYYSGPFREQMIYLPTIMYCAFVPGLNMVYVRLVRRLNEYENHETESYYEYNLSQKIFVANFLIGYLSLFFIGWIYIPFNEEIGNYFESLCALVGLSLTVKPVGPERLKNELKYFVITGQIINFAMEIGLPYAIRFVGYVVVKTTKNEKQETTSRNEDEESFLKRVRQEVKLPVYDIYEDYAEMILQYGYVALFSVVWPLAPLAAFLNNVIELRSDAVKLCVHTRRPIPARADSIGPWLDSLMILTWLSAVTNPSFVYLYQPSSNTFTSPSAILVTLALVWFSEHILITLRYCLHQGLAAFPSWADELVMREEYELKKRWLDKMGVVPVGTPTRSSVEDKEKQSKWFWDGSDQDKELEGVLEGLKME